MPALPVRAPGKEGVTGNILNCDICHSNKAEVGRLGRKLIRATLMLNREFVQHK